MQESRADSQDNIRNPTLPIKHTLSLSHSSTIWLPYSEEPNATLIQAESRYEHSCDSDRDTRTECGPIWVADMFKIHIQRFCFCSSIPNFAYSFCTQSNLPRKVCNGVRVAEMVWMEGAQTGRTKRRIEVLHRTQDFWD